VDESRAVVLSSWIVTDEDQVIGEEVLALTDQDGFIPGQIYYLAIPELNKHGEFITGQVHLVSSLHSEVGCWSALRAISSYLHMTTSEM